MKNSLILAIVALGLAGCGISPKDGSDDTTYYYSNRGVSAVPTVQAATPAVSTQNGPVGVAKIVYFDFDRSDIRPQDRPIIEAHASYLRNRPASRVVLEGHTDERGGREYNIGLGQRRADAVKRSLELLGVPPRQLEGISWGMEKPASPERTEEGYQLNRRTEFSYR